MIAARPAPFSVRPRAGGPILPGATLGIIGGGQLGRMTALAARTLGYRVRVLDPDPRCAASGVVDEVLVGGWDDPDAAARLAAACDVVTIEIERAGPQALDAAARHAPVRPAARVLEVVRDRGAQKDWLVRRGFPVPPHAVAAAAAQLARALVELGPTTFVKTCRDGYDGRGQAVLRAPATGREAWAASAAEAAFAELGGRPLIVEKEVEIDAELSVLVARRPSGEVAVHPPALNAHRRCVLDWSLLPAPLPAAVLREAQALARAAALELSLEGILVVELFLDRRGRLLVNELAPRPHNSYHGATEGCATGQYEQLVRAVCDLPLGSTESVTPSAIANLLGDLWHGGSAPDVAAALAVPGTRVHLYGKEPRPGRKLGHIAATAASGDEALARALAARTRMVRRRARAARGPGAPDGPSSAARETTAAPSRLVLGPPSAADR